MRSGSSPFTRRRVAKEEWLPNQVNAALCVIERDAIEFWRDHALPSDIARDLFRAMLLRGASIGMPMSVSNTFRTSVRQSASIGGFRSSRWRL